MNASVSLLAAAWILCAASAQAQVKTVRIASGLDRPLWAGAPSGDARIFIATKGGKIHVLVNGVLRAEPFLDLTGALSTGGEQGLLGMAFHPSFATNGRVYVNYTDLGGGARAGERAPERSGELPGGLRRALARNAGAGRRALVRQHESALLPGRAAEPGRRGRVPRADPL